MTTLSLPQIKQFCFRYNILELSTAVKPWLLNWLVQVKGFDRVVYLDPDIFAYAPLREVEAALDRGALMVLTPHLLGELSYVLHGEVGDQAVGAIARRRVGVAQGIHHRGDRLSLELVVGHGERLIGRHVAVGVDDELAVPVLRKTDPVGGRSGGDRRVLASGCDRLTLVRRLRVPTAGGHGGERDGPGPGQAGKRRATCC